MCDGGQSEPACCDTVSWKTPSASFDAHVLRKIAPGLGESLRARVRLGLSWPSSWSSRLGSLGEDSRPQKGLCTRNRAVIDSRAGRLADLAGLGEPYFLD